MGLWQQVTRAQTVGRGLKCGGAKGPGATCFQRARLVRCPLPGISLKTLMTRELKGKARPVLQVTSGRKGLSKAQKISCQGFAWQNSNVSHLASTLTENWAEQHVPSRQGSTQTEAMKSETESPIREYTSKNTNHARNTSTMKEGTDFNTEDTDTAKRAPIPRVPREKWVHHQGAFKES